MIAPPKSDSLLLLLLLVSVADMYVVLQTEFSNYSNCQHDAIVAETVVATNHRDACSNQDLADAMQLVCNHIY